MEIRSNLVAFMLFVALASTSFSTAAQQPAVAMHVGAPIHLVRVAGEECLLYELHVDNRSAAAIELTSLDVLNAEGKPLLRLDQETLASDTDLENGGTVIPPHTQAVVYLTVDVGATPPASIRHQLTVKQDGPEAEITSQSVSVLPAPGPVLAPPLAGGPWVAVYSDKWPRGHRRVFIATNGHERLPGRFAIDWMEVDDQGRTLKDDSGLVASSYSYGAKVLAVADAQVAAVRDGVTEAVRIADNKTHPHPDAAGNFISLDLGKGRFATYEHLRPGSIKVAKGDHVHIGQVIAEVGFSGDSTEPHLHFHVSDASMPLEGEGLPYVLNQFHVIGRVTNWNAFGSQHWQDIAAHTVEREFPASGDVVNFR